MVDGQFDALAIGFGVFRQQAHIGDVHTDDVLRLPPLRDPVGGGIGGIGGGDLRIGQQIGRAAAIPQRPAQCRRAADGVAVRADMGQQQYVIQRVQIPGGFAGSQNRARHITCPPAARCPRWRGWRA